MDFVITCLPGLGPLLADELTELGISVTDPGNAHVAVSYTHLTLPTNREV